MLLAFSREGSGEAGKRGVHHADCSNLRTPLPRSQYMAAIFERLAALKKEGGLRDPNVRDRDVDGWRRKLEAALLVVRDQIDPTAALRQRGHPEEKIDGDRKQVKKIAEIL